MSIVVIKNSKLMLMDLHASYTPSFSPILFFKDRSFFLPRLGMLHAKILAGHKHTGWEWTRVHKFVALYFFFLPLNDWLIVLTIGSALTIYDWHLQFRDPPRYTRQRGYLILIISVVLCPAITALPNKPYVLLRRGDENEVFVFLVLAWADRSLGLVAGPLRGAVDWMELQSLPNIECCFYLQLMLRCLMIEN